MRVVSFFLGYFISPCACRTAVSEADLLASVRERYTTIKRLVVTSASPSPTTAALAGLAAEQQHQQHQVHPAVDRRNVLVEVQFSGPQPSEGPAALFCELLGGYSVEAKPVGLTRGRKKRARKHAAASSKASDSGVCFFLFFSCVCCCTCSL